MYSMYRGRYNRNFKMIAFFVVGILILGTILTSSSYIYAANNEIEVSVFWQGYLAGKIVDIGGRLVWKAVSGLPAAGIASAIALTAVAGVALIGIKMSADGIEVDYGYNAAGCIMKPGSNVWQCPYSIREELNWL